MIYFISDLHFNHGNIIKYCNRPFRNVEEMNNYLINYWNKIIKTNDTVYILGDFAFSNPIIYSEKLSGYKILILGNHDKKITLNNYKNKGFDECYYTHIIDIKGYKAVLSHYPYNISENIKTLMTSDISFNIHGHLHGNYNDCKNCIDVGWDVENKFLTIDEIFDKINKKQGE